MNLKPRIIDEGITASGREYVALDRCGSFSLRKTFDCGQTFRFEPVKPFETDPPDTFSVMGNAFGKWIQLSQSGDRLTLYGANSAEYENLWKQYLDFDEDYDAADEAILAAMPHDGYRQTMARAVEYGRGIRILRQDPFEALISFIISQNNNIPRIKKIIDALCRKYGVSGAFPTPDALAGASQEDLMALGAGYRAKYIRDAAEKIAGGDVDLGEIIACEDYSRCTELVSRINGVGPKVASCVLLFGFHKTEAFPIDVWMKKSLARHFPEGFDPAPLGRNSGLCQQYLFYYERWNGE